MGRVGLGGVQWEERVSQGNIQCHTHADTLTALGNSRDTEGRRESVGHDGGDGGGDDGSCFW
ncbi:hypothetical protein E2C01_046652 [Portunus trituberculatus]|uniref:Uncharacterized protein n=1 Tax=Portunus trituberculatus TaxID=210409 RepID=A0A5B7G8B9_PORTR|nr:hypothetical protein [Portunus trituberculatus]